MSQCFRFRPIQSQSSQFWLTFNLLFIRHLENKFKNLIKIYLKKHFLVLNSSFECVSKTFIRFRDLIEIRVLYVRDVVFGAHRQSSGMRCHDWGPLRHHCGPHYLSIAAFVHNYYSSTTSSELHINRNRMNIIKQNVKICSETESFEFISSISLSLVQVFKGPTK